VIDPHVIDNPTAFGARPTDYVDDACIPSIMRSPRIRSLDHAFKYRFT